MSLERKYKAVVIGGSAGSFAVVSKILAQLNKEFPLPIILCLHRLKHVRSGLVEGLNLKSNIEVVEPFDKEKIMAGRVYLAPANYHLFLDFDYTFSLSTEEVLNHSRPLIDHTLSSAGFLYREKLVGILLTGANRDGAKGMKDIADKKGFTIVQDPSTCEVDTMPKAALKIMSPDLILDYNGIINFLNSLEAY